MSNGSRTSVRSILRQLVVPLVAILLLTIQPWSSDALSDTRLSPTQGTVSAGVSCSTVDVTAMSQMQ